MLYYRCVDMSTVSKHLVGREYGTALVKARAGVNIRSALELNKPVCLPVAGIPSAAAFCLEKRALVTEQSS